MTGIQRFTNKLWQDEQGQDLIEYALLLSSAVLAVAAFDQDLFLSVQNVFAKTVSVLQQMAAAATGATS